MSDKPTFELTPDEANREIIAGQIELPEGDATVLTDSLDFVVYPPTKERIPVKKRVFLHIPCPLCNHEGRKSTLVLDHEQVHAVAACGGCKQFLWMGNLPKAEEPTDAD